MLTKILTDVIKILTSPECLFFSALIISFLTWKKAFARKLLLITTLFAWFCGNGLIPALLVYKLEKEVPATLQEKELYNHHAMVILGGGISISPFKTEPSISGYSRIMKAITVYNQAKKLGLHYTIFISGGVTSSQPTSEAAAYKQQLTAAGIPAEQIITEGKSKNTFENAQFTTPLLQQHKFTSALLITSATHMPRSVKCFEHFGMHVKPVAANFLWPHIHWFPRSYNIAITSIAFHELVGLYQLDIFRWLKIYAYLT